MAIAGGGVGGLALALALQHRSINCVVYERDADASTRKAGYGLTMQQGGRALDALGVSEAVRAAATPTDRHVSIDANTGAELGVHGERSAAARRRGRGARAKAAATHLPRGTLRDVLLDRLRPDTVRWGAKLESASPSDDGWSLTVDGVTESCSVLVGADGVRSTARRLLCAEDAAATPLGVFVVLGFCSRRSSTPRTASRPSTAPCGSTRCPSIERERCGSSAGAATGRRAATEKFSARPPRTRLGLAGLPRRGAAHRSDGAGRRHGLSDRR